MNEVKFLLDQIKTTFNGDSWHGPSLIRTLENVDYEQAKARPIGERHTIWELVNHTTYWLEEVKKVMQENKPPEVDFELNWPKMGMTDEDWELSVKRLEAAVNMLMDELAEWTNDDLARMVPNMDFTYKQMLHGAVHHNLYHAGQISILKKKV